MISQAELVEWLNTLSPDTQVGIDEEGLTLITEAGFQDPYLEVGGIETEENR